MINVSHLSKSYGKHLLFKNLSFNINKGERIGLIGRNGYGKTTLFQIILGNINADSGTISIPKDYKIGCLEQKIKFTEDTVIKEGCLGLRSDEKNQEWKVKKILMGLGFTENNLEEHPSKFSGGFQIRLSLGKLIVSRPDLLLLDEPNNYLDIVAIRWLIRFLRNWKNELMIITHDRQFMDSVTTHTMIIHRKCVRKIEGNTSKLYNQISQDEEIYEKTRLNEEKKRKKTEVFISKFRAKARLGGLVQSRIKSLEKQKSNEKLEKLESLNLSFRSEAFLGPSMINADDITFSYDNKKNIIENMSLEIGKKDRICVIGRNGKGKSTLLRILAGELIASKGSLKNHKSLKIGYFAQPNISRLCEENTVAEEIMFTGKGSSMQNSRNICGKLMFSGENALKKVSVLSGGERCRVLLGKLLVTSCHMLLLDEPTNHLDMESCDSLMNAIEDFNGSVVMVTHNEMYLEKIAERLIIFDKNKITLYEGGYQDFIRNIGWESEKNEKISDLNCSLEKKQNQPVKKDLKRLKAQIRQEKSRVIKPLENKIKDIEEKIYSMENEIHVNTEMLVEASGKGDAKSIADFSKKDHEFRIDIDNLYSELEKINEIFENEKINYDKKLDELENN